MRPFPIIPLSRCRPPAFVRLLVAVVSVSVAAAVVRPAGADEGMWLFNQPPLEALQKQYGATLSAEWLAHVQQAAVRFSSGGSGSFVSADGLVLTNHHVGADAIAKLGDETHDYMRDGFAAATRGDELKCHDLELNVLVSIEDVTARVQGAVAPSMAADEAAAARRRVMAEIEKESLAATGLRSDVVTLYQGGAYHLYRARKYTDVRLVFAPEKQIAFFGGDADNFEFPRYNLDVCFFRAYEKGKPARVPHHLRWAARPVGADDLVFVAGHPGRTDRANTLAELLAMRDRSVPATIQTLERLETTLGSYATEGPEQARQANDDLFGVQNNRKRQRGMLAGLLDPAVLAAKQRAEAASRSRYEERIRSEAGPDGRPSAYARIEEAEAGVAKIALRYRMLEAGQGFNSAFFTNARTLLRAAEERAKPNGERLREHRDSNRESLELRLLSAEPLYDDFEIVKLADSLTALVVALGTDDELVRAALAGKSPRERAAELVRGTTLGARPAAAGRPDTRRDLLAGGAAAVAASNDPMLGLARMVDAESRRLRKIVEAAQEVKQQAHAEITRDRFASEGAAMYPDATFTLRLAYGTVKGYEEDGRTVAPITTYGGLFARAREKRDTPPFDLPPRWSRLRPRLEADPDFLATPFNFVCTADIIGGNSGSPVVNRAGELVGLIFDGNIHSLVTGITYDAVRSRAVSVDATGIRTALRTVYGAGDLLAEIDAAAAAGNAVPGSQAGGATAADAHADWRPLFDGKALGPWKPSDFGGGGEVSVVDGAIRIEMGADLSGITWSGDFPRDDYEIEMDARRVEGGDFFCGLTFPVGKDPCSFIVGGWGGGVVGLSSIDGEDAANNATTSVQEFKTGRWYAVRVRVTAERIVCFLDGRMVVDQRRAGRTISIRDSVAPSKPLGIATYATVGELKNIRWRPVEKADAAQPR